ncbi:hypothetical protein ENBRE01_0453 [Enteropsectra breve]|nr:hypothetical protein ENBRE01_0453 [Enteropsectra breve]
METKENAIEAYRAAKGLNAKATQIKDKIIAQNVVFKAIESETAKNAALFHSTLDIFDSSMKNLEEDTRNRLILILLLIVIALFYINLSL